MAMVMILVSASGKKEDFVFVNPIIPNRIRTSIKTLTATVYFIKKVISFFITLV